MSDYCKHCAKYDKRIKQLRRKIAVRRLQLRRLNEKGRKPKRKSLFEYVRLIFKKFL